MLHRYSLLGMACIAFPHWTLAQTPQVPLAPNVPVRRQLPPGRFPEARAKVDTTVNLTFKLNGEIVSPEQQMRPVGDLFANYTVALEPVKLLLTNGRPVVNPATTPNSTDAKQQKRNAARQAEEDRLAKAIKDQELLIANNQQKNQKEAEDIKKYINNNQSKYTKDSANYNEARIQAQKTSIQLNQLISNSSRPNSRTQYQLSRLRQSNSAAWRRADSVRAERDSTRNNLRLAQQYLAATIANGQKREQQNKIIQRNIQNLNTTRTNLANAVWLLPQEVAIDQTNFDAYAAAHQLLLVLRQDAMSYDELGGTLSQKRKNLGVDSRWSALLFPHGSLWPWRWHWPGRKYNRIGTRRERQVIAAFEHRLAQQLNAQWQPPAPTGRSGILAPRRDSAQTAAGTSTIASPSAGGNITNSLPLGGKRWLYLKPAAISGQQRLSIVDRSQFGLENEVASVELSSQSTSNVSSILATDLQNQVSNFYQNQYQGALSKLLIVPDSANANRFIKTFNRYQESIKRIKPIQDSIYRFTVTSPERLTGSDPKLKSQLDRLHYANETANRDAYTYQQQLQDMVNKTVYTTNTSLEYIFSDIITKINDIKQKLAGSQIALPDLTDNVQTLLRAAQPSTPATASVGENGDLIYHGQLLLPTSPMRRVAHVYIRDRGEGAAAQLKPRYVVCLQYSATNGSYQDLTVSSAACTPPLGYLGVSAELTDLERTAVVETLSGELNKKDALLEAAAKKIAKTDSAKAAEHRAQKLNFDQTTTAAGTVTVPLNQTTEQIKEVLRDFYDNYLRSIEKLAATPYAGAVLMGQRITVYQDTWGMASPTIAQSPLLNGRARAAKARAAGTVSGRMERNTRNVSEQPQPEYFLVDSVQVEIEDGNMMALKAHGRYRELRLLFESYAPIGLSSDAELKKWYDQRLYAQSSFKRGFARDTGSTGRYDRLREEHGLYIYLDDLMRYHPLLSPRAGDRSPADAVYTFRPQDALDKRVLHRTPTAKILQARVYSDLVGITNDRPNGLIQAELNKRIILNGHFNRSRAMPMAWGHYMCPLVSINKIEQNNRRLDLTRYPAGSSDSLNRKIRTIDLLRYTYLRVGLAQNIVTVRVPQIKSDFSFDMSGYLSRVAVHDTIPPLRTQAARGDNLNLTVLTYGPQIIWRVRPDSRWGFQARVASVREKLLSNRIIRDTLDGTLTRNIEQSPSAEELGLDGHTIVGKLLRGTSQNLMQYELLFWTSTSANSELFFRTQFSHLRRNHSHAFFQLQIGYQFDVFTNRRTAVMPAGLFPGK